MFRKLQAIWKLLTSDHYALFTLKEAPEDPVWLTASTFSWIISSHNSQMFSLIEQRLDSLYDKITKKAKFEDEKTDC